ncbi:hypothetical protein ACPPVO_18190 [Dactylosporangium sp. McL0621]|uniref:hypothetical protein n=1 Tax=Dactylosporangium sp. McL0621 TaxID=3415678 RepID=UPI003CEB6826
MQEVLIRATLGASRNAQQHLDALHRPPAAADAVEPAPEHPGQAVPGQRNGRQPAHY